MNEARATAGRKNPDGNPKAPTAPSSPEQQRSKMPRTISTPKTPTLIPAQK